ncbi:MAG: TPM domain-containing protein, partial [Polyangiaceae bacterium]|nr:TPM domain-containing protein [Polyangiaceae bacterium]
MSDRARSLRWLRLPSGLVLFAAVCLGAGPAHAYVPPIDGHLTDPGHHLKSTEKDSLEELLGKIQSDTQVDCAGWVMATAVPANELADLGREAFDHWHIGRDWENGVFFVFPTEGRAILVQNPSRPALSPADVTKVLGADVPASPLSKRIEHDANE